MKEYNLRPIPPIPFKEGVTVDLEEGSMTIKELLTPEEVIDKYGEGLSDRQLAILKDKIKKNE